MEMQQSLLTYNSLSPSYNFDHWAEPPDHGLWPISSILEHISPAELARYLHTLQQELGENDCAAENGQEKPSNFPPVVPLAPVIIGENGRRRYQCTICFKFFTQASSLRVHGRIHTGEKPFECEICHKAFNQSGSLRLHRTVHSSERPYSCDTCHKTFSRVRSLKLHMRTHTGRKPYKCDTCLKCFSHHSTLKIHVKLHSDQRPFSCDSCDKTFDQHEALVYHTRMHRPVKPYECLVCGKRFPTPQSLSSHGRVHENGRLSVEKVDRMTATEEEEERMVEVEENTVYECNVCGKGFSRKTSLRAHKISHDRKPRRKVKNKGRRH